MSSISTKINFQTLKCEPNRSLLSTNLLVLVPTAVMARSLILTSQPLKTKIRNFSGKVSSLYRNPGVITREIFRNCAPSFTARRAVETLNQLCQLSFSSPRNTVTQRANFAPFFPLFFSSLFSSFSRFYLIVRLFALPKI